MEHIEHYMALPYATHITMDNCGDKTCYVARHNELPGCMAQGWTPQEAVDSLRDARRLYIESLLQDKLSVPLPAAWLCTILAISRIGYNEWTAYFHAPDNLPNFTYTHA